MKITAFTIAAHLRAAFAVTARRIPKNEAILSIVLCAHRNGQLEFNPWPQQTHYDEKAKHQWLTHGLPQLIFSQNAIAAGVLFNALMSPMTNADQANISAGTRPAMPSTRSDAIDVVQIVAAGGIPGDEVMMFAPIIRGERSIAIGSYIEVPREKTGGDDVITGLRKGLLGEAP